MHLQSFETWSHKCVSEGVGSIDLIFDFYVLEKIKGKKKKKKPKFTCLFKKLVFLVSGNLLNCSYFPKQMSL